MVSLELHDKAALNLRPGGINALALAKPKLIGKINGQVTECRQHHRNFRLDGKSAFKLVIHAHADLWIALIKRAESQTQSGGLKHVRQSG